MGIERPEVTAPVANDLHAMADPNILTISGQRTRAGGSIFNGTRGAKLNLEFGVETARVCAIALLAVAKSALGKQALI